MASSTWGWPEPAPTTTDNSFDSMIASNATSPTDAEHLQTEAILGTAAVLLAQRGETAAASLLLDVIEATDEWNENDREMWLWLEVSPEHRAKFTDDVMHDTVRPVIMEVMKRRQYHACWVDVRETLPSVGPNWREQVKQQLSDKGVTNQGRRARLEAPRYVEDNFVFTNAGELKVYRVLRKIQEQDFPRDDTIGIFPLPGVRVPGHSWEPDVLVTYKGRAGVLEIDGPHHNGRRALDTTRDHLLRDAGVAVVDRVPVEALASPAELTTTLRRFLKRLEATR